MSDRAQAIAVTRCRRESGLRTVETIEGAPVERASTTQRTVVIVLAQVVALAVIAVVWSVLRSRRAAV